jgi:hypothetical protein
MFLWFVINVFVLLYEGGDDWGLTKGNRNRFGMPKSPPKTAKRNPC